MNSRFKTWLGAALVLVLASCSGDKKSSVLSPELAPPLTVGHSPTEPTVLDLTYGMGDVWDYYQNGPINCTANDTNLFATVLAQGQDEPTCYENTLLPDMDIIADVVSTSKSRFDI